MTWILTYNNSDTVLTDKNFFKNIFINITGSSKLKKNLQSGVNRILKLALIDISQKKILTELMQEIMD